MKNKITYLLLFTLFSFGYSCKDHCRFPPDTKFFLHFNIVDQNGHSLLINAYPINTVIIYDIEDSLDIVQSWKRPEDPSIGIQYFDDKKNNLGENHRKYGIKLNQFDTDTLEMFFTVGPVNNCEYQIDSIILYYNYKRYKLLKRNINFIKQLK